MEKFFIVDKKWENVRLDKFLSENIRTISRSKIHKLISEGAVKINQQIKKPSYRLKVNEKISILIPQIKIEYQLKPFNYEIKIIYEDEDIIVVDKPAGLSVHPPNQNTHQSVISALFFMGKKLSTINPQRAGVIHRLDKDTTGVMVLAKNNFSHLNLIKQFQRRVVKKTYLAICWGNFVKEKVIVNLPLCRDKKNRLKIKIGFVNAKEAYTTINLIENLKDSAFLSIAPLSGRMHQIRVHLKFLEHPIVGDKKYGIKDGYDYLFLHSHKLGFIHPTKDNFVEFISPMPKIFEEFISVHKSV
ncbi:MAG: RluA family pseudouridine synthase [Candidatus Omnitrophica bacterium]|nr:RluA family pseudouridine synthase [Candidatus Omnitrophota bacterium]